MMVKSFPLGSIQLPQYAFSVTNANKGKIEIFINRLKSNITKDLLIRDNPLRSYSKTLSRALKYD